MATVLQIAEDAARSIGLTVPSSLYGVSETTDKDFAVVIEEIADYIIEAHDWSTLATTATIVGTGGDNQFALPADFLRIPDGGQVWPDGASRPLLHVLNGSDWLGMARKYSTMPAAFYVEGGLINILPTLASGQSVALSYLSSHAVTSSGGAGKTTFTADDDVWRLDDQLLRLGITSRFRELRGLPFERAREAFEEALSTVIMRDKGTSDLRPGSRRDVGDRVAMGARMAER